MARRLKNMRSVVDKPRHLVKYVRPQALDHGKAWMYEKHRCWPACFECYEAARKYRKRKVYRRDTGAAQTRVDPEPARNAVRRMVRRGYSIRFIGEEAGIHLNTVRRLYRTDWVTHYMMSDQSEKLIALAKRDDNVADSVYKNMQDPELARLAIQGLMRQGFSQTWIGKQVNLSPDAISRIVSPTHTSFIRHDNIKNIVSLARATGSKEGDSNRSRSYAIKQNWEPTIAHDALM